MPAPRESSRGSYRITTDSLDSTFFRTDTKEPLNNLSNVDTVMNDSRGRSMWDQLSFASLDFAAKKKRTKRDVFLSQMGVVVPWAKLEALIEPHYPKMGPQGGRRPFPLPSMLRIYCLQQWYNLSDPGAEEALYDIQSMRAFAGLELGRDSIPDETTILNFRHLLERHDLTKAIFEAVAEHLAAKGELLRGGGGRRALGREGEGQAGPRSDEAPARQEPPLRQGAREGRTRLPRGQMPVRLSQGPLSRHRQERRAGVFALRTRQSLSRPRPTCVRLKENGAEKALISRARRRKSSKNHVDCHRRRKTQLLFRGFLGGG